MVYLVLWLCTSAHRDNCIVQRSSAMPERMTTSQQIEECVKRASATEWMLLSNRFFSCELKQDRVTM